jgi:hypothetical protein
MHSDIVAPLAAQFILPGKIALLVSRQKTQAVPLADPFNIGHPRHQ